LTGAHLASTRRRPASAQECYVLGPPCPAGNPSDLADLQERYLLAWSALESRDYRGPVR